MPNAVLHQLAVLGSVGASTLCGWRGTMRLQAVTPPPKPLRLYDYEACPFCRRVRETLTALGLSCEIRPCPRGGERFRPEAIALGGKRQFPLLVDPNHDMLMYESADIVAYLFRTYAGREAPARYLSPLAPLLGSLGSGLRLGHGARARRSRPPELPLRLWSFESSPYSRLVRERLCELELPYTLYSLGKEHWREMGPAVRRIQHPYTPRPGDARARFFERHQQVQVPYLEDPNTGRSLFESARILDYLESRYAYPSASSR